MPIINLTDEEAQALIQMLINSNPILVKVIRQVQEQSNVRKEVTDGARDRSN